MIPNRDTLIVTGSDDVTGLERMVAVAKDAFQTPRPISGLAWKLDGDDWVPWIPPASHPLYGEFRLFQIRSLGQDYSEQKAGLDSLHEKTGEDIFVASFSARQYIDTGEMVSYCAWSKDVPALLPRADQVVFVPHDRDPAMAAWDRVVDTVGELMEPLDMYPARYRVSEFPTDAQMVAMGCEEMVR
jgi:hypothetical protein